MKIVNYLNFLLLTKGKDFFYNVYISDHTKATVHGNFYNNMA